MSFKNPVIFCATIVLALASQARGQLEISWYTVDGGGVMNSANGQPGGFEMSGTIGQPDAQAPPVMSGGTFELTGGFWGIPAVCSCPGDMNADGLRNGRDIQQFTNCMISGGSCACAEIDGTPGLTQADIAAFVANLLSVATCP